MRLLRPLQESPNHIWSVSRFTMSNRGLVGDSFADPHAISSHVAPDEASGPGLFPGVHNKVPDFQLQIGELGVEIVPNTAPGIVAIHRFEVRVLKLGPYQFVPCLGGA